MIWQRGEQQLTRAGMYRTSDLHVAPPWNAVLSVRGAEIHVCIRRIPINAAIDDFTVKTGEESDFILDQRDDG